MHQALKPRRPARSLAQSPAWHPPRLLNRLRGLPIANAQPARHPPLKPRFPIATARARAPLAPPPPPPRYLGVLQGLIASGAFKPGLTPITGVSTGAQAAALGCAGGSPATALAGALVAAQKCLDTNLHPPCQYQLDAVLRGQLNQSMPSGAAAKCNGTLTLGFSAPYPLRGLGQYNEPRMGARRGFTTSNFTSDGDLEDGVAASGYLACLSDQKPYTTYKGKLALAGGYS